MKNTRNIVASLIERGWCIFITDMADIMADGFILTEVLTNDSEARKIYLGEKFRM